MVGLARLFDSRRELWPLVGSSWSHVCRVVRFSLTRCKLVRISVTLSKMSEGLIVVSKRSNSTFILLYLYHEMDVSYLVVDDMLNIIIDLSQLHVLVQVVNLWC
jgi:hypothetical protein